ncbi:MAG: hypothetical protein LC785_02995 [Acidobacteria bacterium]|nr:hypothetical protein [Acidobacteriota bacterium]
MFGSTVLEVAIGMVFVYLLLSLLCSAVNEYIEAKLNYRAQNLWKGVQLLLNGKIDDSRPKPVGAGDDGAGAAARPGGGGEIDLASELYNHGLVRALYRDAQALPSYIPSRTFALALWNMAGAGAGGDTTDLAKLKEIVAENVPNKHLRESLVTLIDEARGDFTRAQKNIEDWFDGAMDRVSGWYKRRVQVFLLIIGVVVALLINADTINIGKALVQNDALRESLVAQAAKEPAPAPGTGDQQEVRDLYARLSGLGLPLGWVQNTPANANDPRRLPGSLSEIVLKLFGITLTALAISQGAPFWFDLLNKFMVIRSTVKPKEKSPDEGSKD